SDLPERLITTTTAVRGIRQIEMIVVNDIGLAGLTLTTRCQTIYRRCKRAVRLVDVVAQPRSGDQITVAKQAGIAQRRHRAGTSVVVDLVGLQDRIRPADLRPTLQGNGIGVVGN